MEFKFIKCRNRDEGTVRLDGYEIPKQEFSISWINYSKRLRDKEHACEHLSMVNEVEKCIEIAKT